MDLFNIWNSMGAWRWLTLAAVLVAVELGTGTTWFLWFAAAAIVTALAVALPGELGVAMELVVFAAASVTAAILGRRLVKPGWLRTEQPGLNLPTERLVGSRATAVTQFANGEGRVSLGDTQWRAVLDSDDSLPAGSVLDVVGVEGGTLRVRRPDTRALPPE